MFGVGGAVMTTSKEIITTLEKEIERLDRQIEGLQNSIGTCGRCIYFDSFFNNSSDNIKICRRRSPGAYGHPNVAENDWCGEFKIQ